MHNRTGNDGFSGVGMADDRKVIPFRKRPPSQAELEAYQRMTRNWHPEMRRLFFPEFAEKDQAGTAV
jgi:hypothetical protein